MTARRIVIIQGHPDGRGGTFCHALADAYAEGAAAAGHAVARLDVGRLDVPLLRDKRDFEAGAPPPDIQQAQAAIRAAEHLVIVHPLWLGAMPALLKAFFEQVMRPTFAFRRTGHWTKGALGGRSARIIVTMGMPALVYRWYFGAPGLRSLERNILRFCGVRPVRATLIGRIDAIPDARRRHWLAKVRALGGRGA